MAAIMGAINGTVSLPIDDDYDELRRRIWLATDAAYKKALENLSSKKAALAAKGKSEESVPSFSKEPARQETEILPPVDVKLADAEHLVRAASAVFLKLPMVETSEAQFEVLNSTEHFLNSEGTSYVRQVPDLYFRSSASMQNATGETFTDNCQHFGHTRSDLPTEAALVDESQAVVDRLSARRKGKVARRYSGPVLFEGDAAAELIAHHFANLLASHPAGSGGGSAIAVLLSGPTASLINKVGSRVMPDFLTVTDNPTLTTFEGHPLFGNYKFDAEGVPPHETVLIKDGVLKTLLTSRTPVRGMLTSTGNQREHGVAPGNLFIDASKTSTHDELLKQLTDLITARGLEYGYILRRLNNNQAIEAIRVYPDGHQDTVRDARIAEINANSFKDILAVSKDRTVYTDRLQGGGLAGIGSGADLITYVVPDLLFEDITVEHVTNETPKLPDISSPLPPL